MGGRKPTVSDDEILRLFTETEDPILSATEVADSLPIGPRGTHTRLKKLHDRGLLERKSVGQGMAYWLTDDGRASLEETED
jgi:Mn-dependent DtxR family transcriptional regulator